HEPGSWRIDQPFLRLHSSCAYYPETQEERSQWTARVRGVEESSAASSEDADEVLREESSESSGIDGDEDLAPEVKHCIWDVGAESCSSSSSRVRRTTQALGKHAEPEQLLETRAST
ncbi:unnamed protein product, partial [Effrenium voratum]